MERQRPLDMEHTTEDNNADDSDEVVFVSEGPQRPVLAFIDLSDEESNVNDHNKESKEPVQDRVDAVKAHVQSTLDRLARDVEDDRESRRAHNELSRVQRDSLQAHGTFVLGLSTQSPDMRAAKMCVEYYAKKPALRPRSLHVHRRHQPSGLPASQSCTRPLNCPVRNCLRDFDNQALLLGHLKRFDHSPCDPCVMLKGVPSVQYVCGPCQRVFRTQVDYEVHLLEKLKEDSSLSTWRPHKPGAPPLLSRHFACPACFLLFTLYDGCLQHMQQQSHFRSTFPIETHKHPCPILVPDYAKNMLVSLCREVEFTVTCGSCGHGLRNNNHVTEHFRSRCQGGWPLALSKRSVSDVAEAFWSAGRCLQCGGRSLRTGDDCAEHEATSGHMVWRIPNMQVSLVAFCHFRPGVDNGGGGGGSDGRNAAASHRPQPGVSSTDADAFLQAAYNSYNGGSSSSDANVRSSGESRSSGAASEGLQWVCECGSVLTTEKEAFEHLVLMNGVRFRCLVCRTLFTAESIAKLHMSRTHGGAHLSDYERWCCSCKTSVPDGRDGITGHLLSYHPGHSFYSERRSGNKISAAAAETEATAAAAAAAEGPAKEPEMEPVGSVSGGTRNSKADGTSHDSTAPEQKKTVKQLRKKRKVVGDKLIYKCCFCKKASYHLQSLIDHLNSPLHPHLPKEGPYYLVVCSECRLQLPPGKSTCQRCVARAGGGGSGSGGNGGVGTGGGVGHAFSIDNVKVQFDSEPKPMPFIFTGSSSATSSTESDSLELPTAEYLSTMSHVLLVDLDNWPSLFQKLPAHVQTGTFIWGFKGGQDAWRPPEDCAVFRQLRQQGCFFLHPQCSQRKDATDFAICLHAGRMDAQLPKHIPLSVLSGDKGFVELKQQFARTGRQSHVLDPHHTDADLLCTLINSIADACSDAKEEAELREALARSLKDMGTTQAPFAS